MFLNDFLPTDLTQMKGNRNYLPMLKVDLCILGLLEVEGRRFLSLSKPKKSCREWEHWEELPITKMVKFIRRKIIFVTWIERAEYKLLLYYILQTTKILKNRILCFFPIFIHLIVKNYEIIILQVQQQSSFFFLIESIKGDKDCLFFKDIYSDSDRHQTIRL